MPPAWILLATLAVSPAASHHAAEQARQLVRRSFFEYDTGAYAQALVDIERAYELDPLPALLFNVGQCQRALGHHREAAIAFKSYLRELPHAKNRAQAEALFAEMTRLAAAEAKRPEHPIAARPAQPPATAPPAPAPVLVRRVVPARPAAKRLATAPPAAVEAPRPVKRHGLPAASYWLGGGGVVAAAVGTVLYVLASGTLAQDHAVASGGLTEHQLSHGQYTSAATEQTVGVIGWVAGGALLAGAGIAALVGGGR